MNGVALKVTYCDGGANGGIVGFNGVCSDRNIVENIKSRHMTWCSQPNNRCRMYFDSGLRGKRPEITDPAEGSCYESVLLTQFGEEPLQFGAGYFHNGEKQGQPIPIKHVEPGDIAVLTTLLPGAEQSERIVFGCFRVAKVEREVEDWGNVLVSDGEMEVILPDQVARQTRFWDYYANADGSELWGAGLFRYLREDQTKRLLSDLVRRLDDHDAKDLILHACGNQVPLVPSRPSETEDETQKRSWGRGSGGEGEAHLSLKMLIASNPGMLGLPNGTRARVEYPFLSGDQVDVMFELPDGTLAVAEVETNCPLPGIHQAIKYRALLEVERGHDLCSGRVEAVVVAHVFDDESRRLASRYGVRLVVLSA